MNTIAIAWNRNATFSKKRYPVEDIRSSEFPYSWSGIPNLRAVFHPDHISLFGPYRPLKTALPEYEEAKDRLVEKFGSPSIEEPFSFPCMFPDHTRYCWQSKSEEIRLYIDDHFINSVQVMTIEVIKPDRWTWNAGWNPHKNSPNQSVQTIRASHASRQLNPGPAGPIV